MAIFSEDIDSMAEGICLQAHKFLRSLNQSPSLIQSLQVLASLVLDTGSVFFSWSQLNSKTSVWIH